MNFADMIMFYGKTTPKKQAIVLGDRIVTYDMLARGVRSVEAAILAAGIGPNDRVSIVVANKIRHLIVVTALYRLGIVSASVLRYTPDIPSSVVIGDEFKEVPFGVRMVVVKEDWFTHPVDPDAPAPRGFASGDSLARIITSSGTTARPKPIGMTCRVIEDRLLLNRRMMAMAPWDRILVLPHITSSWGFGAMVQALAYGHTLLISSDAEEALQMMSLYSVECLAANPAFLREMIDIHRANPFPLPRLALIVFGGASLPPHLVGDVRSRFCRDLLCIYSSTESGPISFSHIEHTEGRPMASGFLAPWIEVEVIDADERPLPAGAEGRLRVRNQWQAYELAEGPEAAKRWMYPGDIVRIERDGMLSLIGRVADALIVAGRYVTPEQIENALSGFPGIDDVAVLAVEMPGGAREFRAAVVPREGFDEAAMRTFLQTQNRNWAIGAIRQVERIQRNDMGKVARREMRTVLGG